MRLRLVAAVLATALIGVTPASAQSPAALSAMSADSPRRWVGVFQSGAPLSTTPLASTERRIERRAEVVNYFQHSGQGFTEELANRIVARGAVPMITLEMWDPSQGVNQPAYRLSSIATGAYDPYLRQWARDARAFGHEVWIRPLHEMNGVWYPWGGTVNGNSPASFVAAWRHMREVFIQEGADNVRFVWCPNIESIPMSSANSISRYWPGDDYVDFMALDGYNFGTGDGLKWRSFSSLYRPAYDEVCALSAKPLFVAEVGCAPDGGDKSAWIADMFRVIPSAFPRIRGVSYFNARTHRDWRIEAEADSAAAFRSGANSGTWVGSGSVVRVAASDRFATAVEVARRSYPGWQGVRTVVIASGDDAAAADPLSAAGLCAAYDAPLMLVSRRYVPPEVVDGLSQIAKSNGDVTLRVVGGATSVPDARLRSIAAQVLARTGARVTVVRVAGGGDRFATAAAVAREIARVRPEAVSTVLLANGAEPRTYYDALALSAVSRASGAPVLLVGADSVPDATLQALADLAPARRFVAGGPRTVSDRVLRKVAATRWAGPDRYGTAAVVASAAEKLGWTDGRTIVVASRLPDALAGGALAGRSRGVLLLTAPSTLPEATGRAIASRRGVVRDTLVLGGAASVSGGVKSSVAHRLVYP